MIDREDRSDEIREALSRYLDGKESWERGALIVFRYGSLPAEHWPDYTEHTLRTLIGSRANLEPLRVWTTADA
jgi:hypothetical protein